ncbi:hypothetical protein GGI07_004964 [Coemansia sp. Benny D115]|nr:hypothetical protein GGI07_004964 [Coemansia sp. Benny D115]
MDQDKYKDGKDSGDLSLSLDKPVSGIRDVDMEDNFDGGVDRSLEQQESKVVAVPVGMEKVDTDVDVKDKESLDTEIKMTVTDNADQQRVSSGGSVTREESSVQDKAPEDAMSVDEEEQEEEEEDDEESESESDEEGDEVDSSKVRIRTSLDNIEAAPLFTPSDSATDTNKGLMDMQKQWEVCAKISSSRTRLTSRARRLHRRLELRRFKRMLGLPLFDIDRAVQKSMAHRQVPWGERPVDVQAARVVGSYVDNRAFGNGMVAVGSREGMGMVNTGLAINSKNDAVAGDVAMRSGMVTVTAYANSFASRLMGRALLAGSLTSPVAQVSPFHGRLLRPFIWRDQRTFPTSGESTNNTSTSGMAMLHIQRAIRSHGHPLLRKQAGLPDACSLGSTESIDYVYFQKEHLLQVNALLCRTFWPGIDMSEALLYPEFSIVALYGRTVVGCAFLTPDAYLTFIAVCAGWEGAGIASFMVHHLTQTVPTKDVTLHVSATNPAMVLYQIENLLNPCKCTEDKFCTCCRPMFSDYLNRNYPPALVAESTKTLGARLADASPMARAAAPEAAEALRAAGAVDAVKIPVCPSGPAAPCCAESNTSTPQSDAESSSNSSSIAQAQTGGDSVARDPLAEKAGGASCCKPTNAPQHLETAAKGHAGHAQQQGIDGIEKPNCDCGCNCRQKLELLIQTIEARIGQPLNIDVSDVSHASVDASEWVESVLSPLAPSETSEHSGPVAGDPPALLALGSADEGFAAGVLPPVVVVAGGCCGAKSPAAETGQAAGGCCSAKAPAGDAGLAENAAPGEGASLVDKRREVPASSASSSLSLASSCCGPSEAVALAPQQVLPAQGGGSCCTASAPAGDGAAGRQTGCQASSSCCCSSRKRKRASSAWQLGDPDNPLVDADGALACSCGCSKPFEECSDCLKDLCEDVLLRSSF